MPSPPSRPRRLLRRLIQLACAVFAFAVIAGFAGALHPALDLVSHFQIPMLLGGAFLLAITVIGCFWGCAATAAALCIITLSRIAPYWIPADPTGAASGDALRIMTINVRTQNGGHQRVTDEIRRHDPDIVAIFEVSLRWEQRLKELRDSYEHAHRTRLPNDGRYGVLVLSKHALNPIPLPGEFRARWLRAAAAQIETPAGAVRIMAVHPQPPTSIRATRTRDDQLALINRTIRDWPDVPLIVLGDLNATPWSHGHRILTRKTNLRNARRGFGVLGTWHTAIPAICRVPIDHVLVDETFTIRNIELGRDIGSDHLPVVAVVKSTVAEE